MTFPDDLLYSTDHEWLRVDGDQGVIGISAHAVEQLGDVVFVDLPPVGRALAAGTPFGVIESVKAVSDLVAPATGEVVEINAALAQAPELVQNDPYGEGWLVKVRITDAAALASLKSSADYRAFLGMS